MMFNEINFLVFFVVIVGIYFYIPYRFRWIVLLISSYYFYMGLKIELGVLLLFSTFTAYSLAILIHRTENPKKRKRYLYLNLLTNLGLLFIFKYFNFVSESVRKFLDIFSIKVDPILIKVLLPIGISFYTFQTLSYTIDVYRKRIKPERHFGIFALYVAFFPQLVAGPIERASNLLPQFFEKHNFNYKNATDGLKLILWGFFKKIVIADRLALVVNSVYGNPTDYGGIPLLLATFFFAFQLYCDFSGYCDIAIGTTQVMGFRLSDNFNRPYFSRSIAELWNRWHISLTSWFQDYVFKPLYLDLYRKFMFFENLSQKQLHFISFYISTLIGLTLLGLWHGAEWTFVAFGAYHAIMISIYYSIRRYWDMMNQYIRILLTFVIFAIGLVFFRANSISDAFFIITHLFSNWSFFFSGVDLGSIEGFYGIGLAFTCILFLESIHLMQEHVGMRSFLSKKPIWIRWPIYYAIILSILLFGIFKQSDFIYFQF